MRLPAQNGPKFGRRLAGVTARPPPPRIPPPPRPQATLEIHPPFPHIWPKKIRVHRERETGASLNSMPRPLSRPSPENGPTIPATKPFAMKTLPVAILALSLIVGLGAASREANLENLRSFNDRIRAKDYAAAVSFYEKIDWGMDDKYKSAGMLVHKLPAVVLAYEKIGKTREALLVLDRIRSETKSSDETTGKVVWMGLWKFRDDFTDLKVKAEVEKLMDELPANPRSRAISRSPGGSRSTSADGNRGSGR